jgi:L-ascorbate metabolism protein UlaG (beta-lactamase superfamily)
VREQPRTLNGAYTNLDGTTPDKGVADILKWQVDRLRRPRKYAPFVTPRRANDGAVLRDNGAHLTWIGHATFVMRLGEKVIATDPIWSPRVGTVRRWAEPGVRMNDLPPIDVVTVSHSHYDHLDVPTLKALGRGPTYVVPRDVGEILHEAGLPNVVELGWWESWSTGDLTVTLVPAQHWSMRVPWDRNRRLWGGFVYQGPEATAYHAGDTAFSERVFTEIGERFPEIDSALLPIGAYEPQWFMQPQHMGPEEAAHAWEILGARRLVAMHWGTFKLTDEPMGEPPERLRTFWNVRGHDVARLWVLDIGETRPLAR